MKIDYLIVGQGIAGIALSYTLFKQGLDIRVVDTGTPHTATRVASGVCNPITGRRLTKTWLARALFSYLHTFYKELEGETQKRFFYEKAVYRPFNSIHDQNEWSCRVVENQWDEYVEWQIDHASYSKFIDNSRGGWATKQSAFIDTATFLDAYKGWLNERNLLIQKAFDFADLQLEEGQVIWQGLEVRKLIFCEGHRVRHNPYFNYLPFKFDKGEWLKVRIPGGHLENLIKKDVFIIPLEEEETFLISGTYHHEEHSYEPSARAREELSQKLAKVLKLPFEIIDQKAAVRAATKDRRPFIGLHGKHPNLGIFNGLGTKGLSLGPYFAQQFYEFLENGQALPREVNIERFAKLANS